MQKLQKSPLFAVALTALASCTSPATEILVQFETDVAATRVAAVRTILVRGARSVESLSGRRTELQTQSGESALSGSVALVPAMGDPRNSAVTGAIEITLLPVGNTPSLTIRRWFRTSFVRATRQHLRMFIPLACAARALGCAHASAEACTLSDRCEDFGLTCSNDARCEAPDLVPVVTSDGAVLQPPADANDDVTRPDIVLVDSGIAPMDATTDASPDATTDATTDAATDAGVDAASCDANTSNDILNCGACGRACAAAPNATAACVAGQCQVNCNSNFGNCDNNAANGCEQRLDAPSACGSCATSCSGATPLCSGGRCSSGCTGTETRCGTSCANTQTNTNHCGRCDNACPGGANASPTCASGACSLTCNSGFANCDAINANGCEVDTNTNELHCGGCGRACAARANTNASCVAGACSYTCVTGYADCDGNATNGCEAQLSSASSCGTCTRVCSGATPFCSSGTCTSGCTAPDQRCGGTCVNTTTSVTHCGMCNNACPARANSTPTCTGSMCSISCDTGFGNCDGSATNGCETDTRSTIAHCGACNSPCPARANATSTCAASACGFVCNSGFANCDGAAANGCETALNTATNCGMCGRTCSGGTPVCQAGVCVSGCSAGETRCGSTCVDLQTNPNHCSACMATCPSPPEATATCTMAMCGFTCPMGTADCNMSAGDGCETNTTNSVMNCGACGGACPGRTNATATCNASACGFNCNSGFGNCDGMINNGCEQSLSVFGHCGACGANPPEVCNGRDDNCDGASDDGLRDRLHLNVLLSDLTAMRPECMPGTEGSLSCRIAADMYCSMRGDSCTSNGIGPAYASPGLVNLQCVTGSSRESIPISELTMADGNCIADMPNVIACNNAAHLRCQARGFLSGYVVRADPMTATVLCFDMSRVDRHPMAYSDIRVFDPDCDVGRERVGSHCNQAINRKCQTLGMYTGGYGPITSVGNNLEALCVRP